MSTPYDRRTDLFTDWLDAQVTGKSTPDHELAADPELAEICAAADQFHGLNQRLGQYASFSSPTSSSWEDIMATNPAMPVSATFPGLAKERNAPTRWAGGPARQRFDRFVTGVLAAALIVAIGGGAWLSSNGNPFGGGNEPPSTIGYSGVGPQVDESNRIVPQATVSPDDQTSSIPIPTAAECTVEPLTREEVVTQLTLANMATDEQRDFYEQPIEPTEGDATAIMHTYRMWQACGLSDLAFAYSMQFETPWFSADQSPLFLMDGRPVSDEMIEDFADIATADGGQQVLWPPIYGSPSVYRPEEIRTATPDLVPIPEWATPIVFSSDSTPNYATIFAEDIMITGPDTATATVSFVNSGTLEVSIHSPNVSYEFVKVDGQWLLNAYHESQIGG